MHAQTPGLGVLPHLLSKYSGLKRTAGPKHIRQQRCKWVHMTQVKIRFGHHFEPFECSLPLMELVGMMPSAAPPQPPDTMLVSFRFGPDTITCCKSQMSWDLISQYITIYNTKIKTHLTQTVHTRWGKNTSGYQKSGRSSAISIIHGIYYYIIYFKLAFIFQFSFYFNFQ